jgi:hypothetical protein
MVSKNQWRDIGNRAGHAFWQGAAASFVPLTVLDKDVLVQTGLAMLAGGVSSVLSLLKGMVKESRRPSS